jgi:hypothetical protein
MTLIRHNWAHERFNELATKKSPLDQKLSVSRRLSKAIYLHEG